MHDEAVRPLPYLNPPVLHLGPALFTAFDLMVACSVICGVLVTVRRCERLGWDRERSTRLVLWTVFLGGVGSHLAAVLFYRPWLLARNPWLLLQLWGAMSSFGGILGGIIGGLYTANRMRFSRAETLRYFDQVAYAFPFAWLFGRLGCALAHDHLGAASRSFWAVDFPGGPRFDLGLLELLYTIPLAILFHLLGKEPRRDGLYLGLFFTLYGPVRFLLDALRTGDERYLGWTPGQYASLLCTALGAVTLITIHRRASVELTKAHP